MERGLILLVGLFKIRALVQSCSARRGLGIVGVLIDHVFRAAPRAADRLIVLGASAALAAAALAPLLVRAALSAATPPPHTLAAPDGVRVFLGGARLEPLAQRRQERGQQLLGKAGRKLAPPDRGARREA